VVGGAIVHPPFLTRAVRLPILARLWIPGNPDRTPLQLARELLDQVTGHLGDRPVHLVDDAAYIERRPSLDFHGGVLGCGTVAGLVWLGELGTSDYDQHIDSAGMIRVPMPFPFFRRPVASAVPGVKPHREAGWAGTPATSLPRGRRWPSRSPAAPRCSSLSPSPMSWTRWTSTPFTAPSCARTVG
jgi:hypothetical protein